MRFPKEERELQIKLTELQIRHQHWASLFTTLIAIEIAITVSIGAIISSTNQLAVALHAANLPAAPLFAWTNLVTFALIVVFCVATATNVLYFFKLQNLNNEIRELKQKYVEEFW